jgi:hypothetical protein
MGNLYKVFSEVQNIKFDCNIGYIGNFIGGLILFYYINSIRNCECVNKEYIDIIQKCFIINFVLFILKCNINDNEIVLKYIVWIIILVGIYYVYNTRLLINDIYKKKCECADTNLTYVVSIINYIVIAQYLFLFSLLFLLYILIDKNKIYLN